MLVVSGGSVVVEITVYDEFGERVTPISMQWSLVDENGDIVNGKENVTLTPAAVMYVALNGDDLVYVENDSTRRVLFVGTYLSAQGVLNVKKTVRVTVTPE